MGGEVVRDLSNLKRSGSYEAEHPYLILREDNFQKVVYQSQESLILKEQVRIYQGRETVVDIEGYFPVRVGGGQTEVIINEGRRVIVSGEGVVFSE